MAAPVNTMLEASQDPNIVESGYVKTVSHPDLDEDIKIPVSYTHLTLPTKA